MMRMLFRFYSWLYEAASDLPRSCSLGFYRGFSRTSSQGLVHLMLMVFLIHSIRTPRLFWQHHEEFRKVTVPMVLNEAIDAWPDGLVFTLSSQDRNGEVLLLTSRKPPFALRTGTAWLASVLKIVAAEESIEGFNSDLWFVGKQSDETLWHAVAHVRPPPFFVVTDRYLAVRGLDLLFTFDALATVAAHVCEKSPAGWRCEKRHFKQALAPAIELFASRAHLQARSAFDSASRRDSVELFQEGSIETSAKDRNN
eukprot:6198630-Pleurochrysis_carterae.AAC.5